MRGRPHKQPAFAAALRAIRRQRGISRAKLAVAANISESVIRDAEHGYWLPLPDVLVELAGPLGVDPTVLLWHWLRAKVGPEWADRMAASPRLSTDPPSAPTPDR